MNRKTVASCLLAGCQLAFLLLLPIAGRAEWNPWHPDPIIEYHYNYDNVGNIKSIEDSVKNSTSTFTYDEVNRLKSAIGQYGAGGTQQTQTYSYNAVGDITVTPNLPTDGNGNITQLNGKTIEYDYENRPIKITETATVTVTEFKYDYTGQRVFKKIIKNTEIEKTFYVGNIYEVHYSSTAAETQTAHIYAGTLRVASRVTENSMSRTYYYLGDHLGSTRMMTDALGQTVHDVTYEPWGNTVTESSTTYKADHKFTGQMLDDSTGLYYYGARYYDPSLKRFITPDTLIQNYYNPQDLNRYSYAWNNPLRITDPTGHAEGNVPTSKDWFYNKLYLLNQNRDFRATATFSKAFLWQIDYNIKHPHMFAWNVAKGIVTLPITSYRLGNAINDVIDKGMPEINNPDAVIEAIGRTTADVWLTTIIIGEFSRGKTQTGTTEVETAGKGWKTGDPIDSLTKTGETPSWSTVRQRYWKNEALNNQTSYSPENLERMGKGLAPQRFNLETGKVESMELHHSIIPQRLNGPNNINNLQMVWPDEHAMIDPFRNTGN